MILLANNVDVATLFWIQHYIVNSALTPFMMMLSDLAKAGGVWLLMGVVFCFQKKYRATGIAMLVALLIVGVVGNGLLKHLVMRPRPCIAFPWIPMDIPVPAATDYSFPSGHSYASFAAAAVVYFYRRSWGIGAFLLAALIAFSRLYLFVHYPSDVVAGAMFGIGTGVSAVMIVRYIQAEWVVNKGKLWLRSMKKEK